MQTATASTPRLASLNGFARTVPGRIVLGLAATLVVAVAAHISFPLWFTPVPLTLQPLAVLGVGLAFGPVGGFAVMLTYLAEGACGLPVFSPAGLGGVAQIVGLTGGFLMAYPLVAAIAGGLTRAFGVSLRNFLAALIGCTAATAVLFTCGAAWFAARTHLPLGLTLSKTVAPFLPGEAIKVLAAAGIYATLTRNRAHA